MANVKVLARCLRRTADDELAMTIARVFSKNSLANKITPVCKTHSNRFHQDLLTYLTMCNPCNHHLFFLSDHV
ncbi:hypothetical protein DPMN_188509 [Dreissena polymorpha]|uniref:Uncharacterized protein n=1 Tax=Dreissena polymorpha TaxID=45954 RepID=A0A9D4DRR7_DREPO|nr:hypothetical protein DPMN_188509 [Dreissena polymorpha]